VAQSETPAQRDAIVLLERAGGIDALPEMQQRFTALRVNRPGIHVLSSIDADIATSYSALTAFLDKP